MVAAHKILLAAAAIAGLSGCGPAEDAPLDEREERLETGRKYVDSLDFRRSELERSIVNAENGYSRLRLERYALDNEGWETLAVFNPPVRPLTTDDLGAFEEDPYAPTDGPFTAVFDGEVEWSHASLLELGRRAFETYPAQIDAKLPAAVKSEENAADVGLWVDRRERLGGLVRVQLGDREAFAVTCATCHGSTDSAGELVHGRTNSNYDVQRLARLHGGAGGASAWGPGRVDVTGDGVDNPAAITDLRPVRYQSRLHWAATLENSLEALAVRIETLLITSSGQTIRPPREVVFALAYYLWWLGEPGDERPSASGEGRELFEETCARCHDASGTTAGTASLQEVGTDPAVAESSTRTTGAWRIPSLFKVNDRSQWLHDGSVRDLEQMLDPERLEYAPGHSFGTTLDPSQRRALLDFLQTL